MHFRHKITLLEKRNVRDELGGIGTAVFVPWRKCFADVQDTGGGEGIRADAAQRISETRTIFTVRNWICRSCGNKPAREITADMKIEYAGQRYDIKSIQPNGKDKKLVTIEAVHDDSSN